MKISICYPHGEKRYRLAWVNAAGIEKRRYFKTRGAAKTSSKNIQEERERHGDEWSNLPAADKAQVIECLARARSQGYTLQEACLFLESHKALSKLTLTELVKKFMDAKRAKRLRPESIRLLETTLEQFMEGRETVSITLIKTDDVQSFLDSKATWGDWRRRGAIIDLANLFGWARQQKLILENPMDGIERPIIDDGPVSKLSVEDAKNLLKLCRASYPSLVPWLAISLFAGLRQAEVERIDWSQVGSSFIDLRATQAKGRARRLITIRAVLASWLADHRQTEGSVCPKGHRKLASEFRKQFGGLERNVLLHSFISYAIGDGEPIKTVALESGKTEDVIFRHYREVVTPEQAKAFWALRPDACV